MVPVENWAKWSRARACLLLIRLLVSASGSAPLVRHPFLAHIHGLKQVVRWLLWCSFNFGLHKCMHCTLFTWRLLQTSGSSSGLAMKQKTKSKQEYLRSSSCPPIASFAHTEIQTSQPSEEETSSSLSLIHHQHPTSQGCYNILLLLLIIT